MLVIESAFVCAAGRGDRLRPWTDSCPKPLLEVRNRPLLDHVLENLEALSLKRVVINAWYMKDQMNRYVESRQRSFSFELNLSTEEELLGTGGGLRAAMKYLGEPPFLMLNGDCLWQGDLKAFAESAMAAKTEGHWWLTAPQVEQTSVGVAQKRVVKLGDLWEDFSHTPQEFGCFSGIQIFKELKVKELPQKGCILRDYWLQRLEKKAQIGAHLTGLSFWEDLGTPERYKAWRA